MATIFTDPSFLTGVRDTTAEDKPDTEHRTWGELGGDILSKVAEPAVGAIRAGTTALRGTGLFPETTKAADEEVADWQKGLKEGLSPRQKAIDTASYFPEYGQRSAWPDIGSKLLSDAAGFAVPVTAAALTGAGGAALATRAGLGIGAAATTGAAATGLEFGLQTLGETLAQQRDYAMKTSLVELQASPVFQKAWREFDGDEKAAREKFYQDTKDVTGAVINAAASGMSYAAIGRLFPAAQQDAANFVTRLLTGRTGGVLKRGLQGGAETGTAGATMAATGAYTQQQQLVNAGLQPNVDPHVMAQRTEEGALSMLPLTALHLPGRKEAEPPPPPGKEKPPEPDSELKTVLSGQLAVDTGPPPIPGGPEAPHMPPGPQAPQPRGYQDYVDRNAPKAPRRPPPRPGVQEEYGDQLPPQPEPPPGAPPPAPGAGPPPPTPPDVGPPPSPPAAEPSPLPSPPPDVAVPQPPPGPAPGVRRAWLERQLQTEADPRRRAWLEDQLKREPPAAGLPPESPTAGPARPAPPPSLEPGVAGAPFEGGPYLPGQPERPLPGYQQYADRNRPIPPRFQRRLGRPGVEEEYGDQLPPQGAGEPSAEYQAALARRETPEQMKARVAAADEAEAAATRARIAEGNARTRARLEAGDIERVRQDHAAAMAKLAEPAVREVSPETPVTPGTIRVTEAPHARTEAPQVTEGAGGTSEAVSRQQAEGFARLAHERAEKAQAERDAAVATLQEARAPQRTGKQKTGLERALETAIKVYKAGDPSLEGWAALRRQAMNVEHLRREAGLAPKGYLKQIGERPGGPEPAVSAELEGRFGQPREVPTMQGELLTAAEKQFVDRLAKFHEEMRTPSDIRATAGLEGMRGVGATAERKPLSRRDRILRSQLFRREAQRLDAERIANGKEPIFVKALPRVEPPLRGIEPVVARFNDLAAQLRPHRALPPNEFLKVKAVRDALEEMSNIQSKQPLLTPEWVRQKLLKADERSTAIAKWRDRLAVENEPYMQARAAAGKRLYEAGPVSESTAAGQRIEPGTFQHEGETISHAEFERRQANLRKQRAPGTPTARLMEQETTAQQEAAKRPMGQERSVALVQEKLAQEMAAGAERREFRGDLPTAEEVAKAAQEFWAGQQRRAKQTTRTQTTRAKQSAARDEAIKFTIDSVLEKYLGKGLNGLPELLDPLQGVSHKPERPKELVTKPKERGAASFREREADRKLEEEYRARYTFWRGQLYEQSKAARELLLPIIDDIIFLAKHNIEKQKALTAPRGGSIVWDLPSAERLPDGRLRYKIGKTGEVADHFNMLADMMNAREAIKLSMEAVPDVGAFEIGATKTTAIPAATIERYGRRTNNWLARLADDWRNYHAGDLEAINERRRAHREQVEEEKRGVQAKAPEGDEEEGLTKDLPSQELTPEEALIEKQAAAGLTEPTTEAARRQQARTIRKDWAQLIADRERSKKGKKIAGLRKALPPEFFANAPEKPADWPTGVPWPPRRELSAEEFAAAKQRLEASQARGQRLTEAELERKLADIEVHTVETSRLVGGEDPRSLDQKIEDLKNNRRNRPIDGPPPETAQEHVAEVNDARDALATDDPQHPLISDPEPASASLDRAKELIIAGEAADVSPFITPAFLDKLSKVNDGVQVLHAPVEVVGRDGEGQAFYQPNHDRIVLSNNVSSGDYVKNVVHEHVHAATENLLHTDPEFNAEVEDLRQRAERHAERAGVTNERLLYGLRDPHEFLAEASSNPEFRALLQRASAPGTGVIQGVKNVLNGLYRTVRDAWRRLMGNEKDADTALDVLFRDTSTVLGRTDKLLAKTMDRLAMEGRPGAISDVAGRRYGPVRDAATKVLTKARDMAAGKGSFDTSMSLHTTRDLAHRGSPEFRKLVEPITRVMAKIATERQRLIREEDQPYLYSTAKWFRALSRDAQRAVKKFLYDETMHGAYADKSLTDAKNNHVNLSALSDAQVVRNHPEMQKRFDELAKIKGFVEHRELLHEFYAKREKEIRHEVTKALVEHLGLLPKNADTPALKNAAMELIQKHILGEPLNNVEKARLEAIKNEAGRANYRDLIGRIRRTPELKMLAGPYIPLTRHGNWAILGNFKMPEGGNNGERTVGSIDRVTKQPIDDGVRMFDTREAAADFEKRMFDKFGVAQIGGGEWFIDRRTGKRAREYTEDQLHELQDKDPDLRNRLLKAKEIEPGLVAEGPDVYEKKYWVKMQPKLLEFHENQSEANASAAAWRAKHGDDIDVSNAEPVQRGSGKENEKYASAQMQKLIDRAETMDSYRDLNDDQQAALKAGLTLQAAKLSLRRGVRQGFKPREYVAGADPEDLMRNMEAYSGQTSGYLANTKFYVEKNKTRADLDKYMHDTRYQQNQISTVHARARNELYQRMDEPTESNVDTPWDRATNILLKGSMLSRLAGASYFITNATEPGVLGAPNMMDHHNPVRVYGEMANTYRLINPFMMALRGALDAGKAFIGRTGGLTDYAPIFDKAIGKQRNAPQLSDFVHQASELGLFETTASVEYQRALYGISTSLLQRATDWATNVFMAANAAVENMNRFVTGITAYNLEIKKLQREKQGDPENWHQQAVDYAIDVMYKSAGDYRNWNKPSLFNKGPVLRLASQYKLYPQRVIASFIESAVGTFKGETKEARMEHFRRLAGLTGVTIGAAGVLGLPTEILKAPLNALYLAGVTNYTADDAENKFRQLMATHFGPIGQVISDGVSRLGPVDIGGRVGLSNTLFFSSPTSRKPRDIMGAAVGVIFGSGGNMMQDTIKGVQFMVQGLQAMNDGAYAEGRQLLLKGARWTVNVRALADSLDAATSGEATVTPSGRVIRPPMSTQERIIRATGFQPTSATMQREHHDLIKGMADRYTAERTRLVQEWAGATSAERMMIQKRIDAFNRQYPLETQRITRDVLLKAVGVRAKGQKQPQEEMGLPLSKQTRPFLREEPAYGVPR